MLVYLQTLKPDTHIQTINFTRASNGGVLVECSAFIAAHFAHQTGLTGCCSLLVLDSCGVLHIFKSILLSVLIDG